MTDGDDNTKDSLTMLELWFPRIYIPHIIFRHYKQTNLTSANSPLDMPILLQIGMTGLEPATS